MRSWPIAMLLVAAPALAEEIRIEVARGKMLARLDAPGASFDPGSARAGRRHELAAKDGTLLLDGIPAPRLTVRPGPGGLRLDGKPLPGRLEAWADARGLVLVNALDLEDYVAAVVAGEVPSRWPAEALRAQAVAARTFAVAQKIAQGPAARAHLTASVLDQVYTGAARPASAALQAARATAGEVLTYGAAPIAAYFSASCGGRSETAEGAFHVAQGTTPYLVSEADDADAGRPWEVRRPLSEISAALRRAGRIVAPVTFLSVASRTGSGRAQTLRAETPSGRRTLLAVELRQILGYTALPSLLFDVSVSGGVAVFRGRGSGHGVGLCQQGARVRALRGESYRDILAHYYPGAEIRRMY